MQKIKRLFNYVIFFNPEVLIGILIFLAVIIGLMLILNVITVLVLSFLMILAVVPTLYKKWIPIAIGVEFMAFATILAGVLYGAKIGAVFGAVAMLISDSLTKVSGEWTFLNVIGMGLGGLVAGLIGKSLPIFLTGLAAIVIIELIRQVPPFLAGEEEQKIMVIVYTIIHVTFTLWLFSLVSPMLGLA